MCYIYHGWCFLFYHGFNGFNGFNGLMFYLGAKQKPNKPLGEDGGRCPAVMLPLWSFKSELLTPKPEAYHPFLQKVTILAKAINRDKPFCLACGSPLKPILWRTALQAAE